MEKIPHITDIKKNHAETMRGHMREIIHRRVTEAVAQKKTFINTHGINIDATLRNELEKAGLKYSKPCDEITW